MTTDPSAGEDPRRVAVTALAREVELHVSAAGWDAPPRLFALVRTAGALARDASLSHQLPPEVVAAARADPEHLTAVEQEDFLKADEPMDANDLWEFLEGISWPATVDGAALVVERSMLPSEAEDQMPDDEPAADGWLHDHPDRQDVRLAVAVLRGGPHACALRFRHFDQDDMVAVQADLVPDLVAIMEQTLH